MDTLAQSLDLVMVAAVCVVLIAGFPVAFSLAGTALLFGLAGFAAGVFDPGFFHAFPPRVFGIMTNEVLIAVPLFVFMGVMLERSKVAEDLLDTMGDLFGRMRGGLGISVALVGALMAASTGIVGATVVTMGLISLPTMLKRGYAPAHAAGTIAAAGTLGQIIPPSIVLVVLGDQLAGAYQRAQLDMAIFAPDTVSVSDLFAGALIPGLVLVGLYVAYQLGLALFRSDRLPAVAADAVRPSPGRILTVLVPPLVLIVAVLGSILGGVATPTEAAAIGAAGAVLLAGSRLSGGMGRPVAVAAVAVAVLVVLAAGFDLRASPAMAGLALLATMAFLYGLAAVLWRAWRDGMLGPVVETTARVTAMIFAILIGATLFSLVFRGLGGDETIRAALSAMPGGALGAVVAVMLLIFVLGFFLDFLEIVFVVVPLVAPVLMTLEMPGGGTMSPVWLGVLIAVNLQTSFLTPPFGFALFYLRGVAPAAVRTLDIYRGIWPYVLLQLAMLGVLWGWPGLATWLPGLVYGD